VGVDGLDCPALLTALTLNWYVFPSTRSGTLPSHLLPVTSAALIHFPESLSFFSMTYPVIGDPPSLAGFSHLRSTWFLDQSFMSGLPGASGSSEDLKN